MIRIIFFFAPALMVLAACSRPDPAPAPAPRLQLTCPDPGGRRMLGEGSTYRDLAYARSEALHGWRVCHAALDAVTQKPVD